jgi:hypothetical protein
MNTKKTLGSLIVVIVVSMLAYLVWGSVMRIAAPLGQQGGPVCTLDAMQCPDGSWVGRSGPDCQFACKDTPATTTPDKGSLQVRLGEQAAFAGESVTPLAIIEDSRCPADVQCIQAGTVRLKVSVQSALGVSERTISLNETLTTESNSISFVAAVPEKKSTTSITPGDYLFTFAFSKR